jgi:hypothetical protein
VHPGLSLINKRRHRANSYSMPPANICKTATKAKTD